MKTETLIRYYSQDKVNRQHDVLPLLMRKLFYKEPTVFEKIKYYGFFGFLYSSLILLCIISCLLFGALKTSGLINIELIKDLTVKRKVIEEITLENARMVSIQNSSPSDVVEIAKIMQDILDTCDNDKQRKFIETALPHAIRFQVQKDIPVSGMIAMSIYESGYGSSELAKKCNNYFGLKALDIDKDNKNIKISYMLTKDNGVKHIQPFRFYENPYAGFIGFYEFLKDGDKAVRYKKALSQRNGLEFIRELLQSGYCPDKNYLLAVQQIIKRHHLYRLEEILKKVKEIETPIKPFEENKNELASIKLLSMYKSHE